MTIEKTLKLFTGVENRLTLGHLRQLVSEAEGMPDECLIDVALTIGGRGMKWIEVTPPKRVDD